MNIGTRIKEQRKFLGMSAEDLAAKLGKDRSTVYRYENGDIENLPLDLLEPIAAALNTTPAFLMGWEADLKNNDLLSEVGGRIRKDEVFRNAVLKLHSLTPDKLAAALVVIDALN